MNETDDDLSMTLAQDYDALRVRMLSAEAALRHIMAIPYHGFSKIPNLMKDIACTHFEKYGGEK